MTTSTIDLSSLFAQLGPDSDDAAIARFIETHSPPPGSIHLHEAPFWTTAQARFLQEAILEDAEWAEVVDTLDSRLRRPH